MNVPYALLENGTLLVASPDLDQGVFMRSVVLVCEHSPNGSFGLILNKTLSLEISEEVLSLSPSNEHIRFCMGGPLQANQMMILHSDSDLLDQSLEVCPSVYLGGDLSFLQGESTNPVNLCFGYSG